MRRSYIRIKDCFHSVNESWYDNIPSPSGLLIGAGDYLKGISKNNNDGNGSSVKKDEEKPFNLEDKKPNTVADYTEKKQSNSDSDIPWYDYIPRTPDEAFETIGDYMKDVSKNLKTGDEEDTFTDDDEHLSEYDEYKNIFADVNKNGMETVDDAEAPTTYNGKLSPKDQTAADRRFEEFKRDWARNSLQEIIDYNRTHPVQR